VSGTYDVIVIGLGAMGAAICHELAAAGQRVLGLEQYDIPNDQGSSHGLTRMYRFAYFESPAYVPLMRRALAKWRDLEAQAGEQVVFPTGSLDAGLEGLGLIEGSLAACLMHDLRHEVLTAGEVNRRFPAFNLPPAHRAVFQPEGGFLAAERGTVANASLAERAGAAIHRREKVVGYEMLAAGGVRVRTDRASYEAGHLVVAAGPWLGNLVPPLRPLAMPERQVTAWLQPDDPSKFLPGAMPIAIVMVEEGPYYFVPIFGGPGVKAGLHHHRRQRFAIDEFPRAVTGDDEAVIRSGVARFMPAANGPLLAIKTCVYTMSPDEHFVVDALPGANDVIVVSACSGHGYKFAPVIGEIVTGRVTGRPSPHDLKMFHLARFAAATPAVTAPAPAPLPAAGRGT
jgi:sarcosine oxidase